MADTIPTVDQFQLIPTSLETMEVNVGGFEDTVEEDAFYTVITSQIVNEDQPQEQHITMMGGSEDQNEIILYNKDTGQYQRCILASDIFQPDLKTSQVHLGDDDQPIEGLLEIPVDGDEEYVTLVESVDEQEKENQAEQIFCANATGEDENDEEAVSVLLTTQLSAEEEVLEESQIVQCAKCARTFLSEDFQTHFEEVHNESDEDKSCVVCSQKLSRKEYLTHFKEFHSDVRLGCPKCPQTYHSPELLNVHYKFRHSKEDVKRSPSTSTSTSSLQADQKVSALSLAPDGLQGHLLKSHNSSSIEVMKKGRPSSRRKSPIQKCEVCLKTFQSQRDFANHRRRKGFCKPPAKQVPPQKRRIGIIRKSL